MTVDMQSAPLAELRRHCSPKSKLLTYASACRLRYNKAIVIQVAVCVLPLAIVAQDNVVCKGPPAMEQAITSQPSAAAYDALGAYSGSRSKFRAP